MSETVKSADAYLKICCVDDDGHRYTIGPFFRSGVTLLKQQVRALNLIYALTSTGKLPQAGSLAIIGGGVAGVTAAAAAASLGCEVFLFEQRPILCHLQHGCDTRWVHPHIYDWPELGSDNPYAGLPLLDWKADTAAEVARQIVSGFEGIRDAAGTRFHLHLGASTWLSDGQGVRWDNSSGDPRGSEHAFDVIILATGFGVEIGVREGETQSYWRNDSVNQPIPGGAYEKPQQFLISGPGDGGLIDLLRTRIESFSQGRLIDELFSPENADDARLIDRLRAIVGDWKRLGADRTKPRTWLFERYRELKTESRLDNLRTRLEKRLRHDTASILNGTALTFSETLSLDRASLFNTLLAFLLYDLKAFSYVAGNSTCKGTEVTIEQDPFRQMAKNPFVVKYNVDRLIVRHGNDRDQVLNRVGLDREAVEAIKKRQEAEDQSLSSQRLWPRDWWQENQVAIYRPGRTESVEFVPRATVAVATTFVSTLSDILSQRLQDDIGQGGDGHHQESADDRDFRITLHRLIEDRQTGKPCFQQIAYYAGTRTAGLPGRVFDDEVGLVGLACRTGLPMVLSAGPRWDELWIRLKAGTDAGVTTIAPSVASMLSCPFFAPLEYRGDVEPVTRVSLVLFMDSRRPGFFTDDVLRIVFSAAAGFVKNLEKLARERTVRFASSAFLGYKVVNLPQDTDLIAEFPEVDTKREVFKHFAASLTFETVKSFDIDM